MSRFLILLFVLAFAGSTTFTAQGKGQAKAEQAKGEKGQQAKGQKGQPGAARVTVVFDDNHRGLARNYFVNAYGKGNCPPGLAKKNNGCMPPGLAKKRYSVGQRLPSGVVVVALPGDLAARIGAAPAGYQYGLVDGDLLKLAVGTMLVVDAIDGFVR